MDLCYWNRFNVNSKQLTLYLPFQKVPARLLYMLTYFILCYTSLTFNLSVNTGCLF